MKALAYTLGIMFCAIPELIIIWVVIKYMGYMG